MTFSSSLGTAHEEFRARPISLVLGSTVSWFLFTMNMTLLFLSVFAVMQVGGTCASGQTPYVINVQCPDNVNAFMPWCIFGGLIAVGIGAFYSKGFGVPLMMWAWPLLFCSLGGLFLAAFFATGDPTGLILGAMFEIMGLVPLVLELRGSSQRVFLGSVNYRGERFYEGERARRTMMSPYSPNPEGAVPATFGDWSVSLLLFALTAVGGVVVAYLWFSTV